MPTPKNVLLYEQHLVAEPSCTKNIGQVCLPSSDWEGARELWHAMAMASIPPQRDHMPYCNARMNVCTFPTTWGAKELLRVSQTMIAGDISHLYRRFWSFFVKRHQKEPPWAPQG